MITLLTLIFEIILMALFCHGINILFWDGHLLGAIGKWYEKKDAIIEDWENGLLIKYHPIKTDRLIVWALKPVIGCVICFASFWGTIAFVGLKIASHEGFGLSTVPEWVIACVCTAYLNYKLK